MRLSFFLFVYSLTRIFLESILIITYQPASFVTARCNSYRLFCLITYLTVEFCIPELRFFTQSASTADMVDALESFHFLQS